MLWTIPFSLTFFTILWHRFWIWFRDEFNWRKWLNWRFGVCFLIAWAILHAPIYAMILCGIPLLRKIGLAIYGFLWLPFVNESVIQIPIAVWLHKRLFKNHNLNMDGFK